MGERKVVWRINPRTGVRTWTYGKWGGAGWSNGKFTPPGTAPDWTGDTDSKLDEVFRSHDRQYEDAKKAYTKSKQTDADKTAYWNAIIQADKAMIKNIDTLRKSGDLGNPPSELQEASDDYSAAGQAQTIFAILVLPEREKSRDLLADPRQLYEEEKVLAPAGITEAGLASALPAFGFVLGLTQSLTALINSTYLTATSARPAPVYYDPIAIDLDGDGIETVGIAPGSTSPTPITFDHNANGVRTGTGWVARDDAWLVLDRNKNGSIDTGRELFGVNTVKANGQRTPRMGCTHTRCSSIFPARRRSCPHRVTQEKRTAAAVLFI
jgi:hypothetical protein